MNRMVWRTLQVKLVCLVCLMINSFFLAQNAVSGYRPALKYGWIFDLIYGVECLVNMASELFVLSSLLHYEKAGDQAYKDLKRNLQFFLAWGIISIAVCYGANLKLGRMFTDERSNGALKSGGGDEHEYWFKLRAYFYIAVTVSATLKSYVLYSVAEFYQHIRYVHRLCLASGTLVIQSSPGLVLPYGAPLKGRIREPPKLPPQQSSLQSVTRMYRSRRPTAFQR